MSTQQRRLNKTETAGLSGLHDVTIGTRVCSIGKFSAIEGWKLIHKLSRATGPLIGAFTNKNFSAGISALFDQISEDEMVRIIRQLTSICLIDGKKITDADLSEYGLILELCGEVIKYNFGDFFSQVMEAMAAIGRNQTGQA